MAILNFSKPHGISTHSSDGVNDGFCEYLCRKEKKKLFVCHRLDKETSGLILFADTKESAAQLGELFETHQVIKTYLFLTATKSKLKIGEKTEVTSHIEKVKNQFVSHQNKEANAKTVFTKLAENKTIELWQAEPQSGKPHQIRLHAQENGIAILGDSEHGGAKFHRLCLHASEIAFKLDGNPYRFQSPAPFYFHELELLQDETLCGWLSAAHRRELLYGKVIPDSSTLRLAHSETLPITIDKLGDVLWFSDFSEIQIEEVNTQRIELFCKKLGFEKWFYRKMFNRGANAKEKQILSHLAPEKWIVTENDYHFLVSSNRGTSSGIFLDQRANRKWVRENSAQKNVLNLFCYTGVFSVAAAKADAQKVVSVDVSAKYMDWVKENFNTNHINTSNHEFRAMDTFSYLDWAYKKNIQFDLVICDPPSFARNEKGVFKIEKDWQTLLEKVINVTKTSGLVLFCTNYEEWDIAKLKSLVEKTINTVTVIAAPVADLDFEIDSKNSILKTLLLQKK